MKSILLKLRWSRLRQKKWPFFAIRSGFLQAVAALRSKKYVEYGGKWAFLGQTAGNLSF